MNSNHLGDPCIHCGASQSDIPIGDCPQGVGLAASVRTIAHLKSTIASAEKAHQDEMARLRAWLSNEQTFIAQNEAGLDTDKIALAETILHVTDYRKGGQDRDSARQDAILWFGTGKAGYRGLRHEFFGTKNYSGWSGQRCDCGYGMGPRHGSICFRIGLKEEARARDLSDAEREAAIYYLINLERIQAARVAA